MTYLDEKYGVIEFDNSKYFNAIEKIPDMFLNEIGQQCHIFKDTVPNGFKGLNHFEFHKLEFNGKEDLNLDWIDKLNIYYNYKDFDTLYDYYMQGHGITFDEKCNLDYIFKKENDKIKVGTIILAVNIPINIYSTKQTFKNKYTAILLHEIAHLYNDLHLKPNHLENNDTFIFGNIEDAWDVKDNIKSFDDLRPDNVKTINIHNMFNLIKYISYYCNISESHVFMENINFEMAETVTNYVKYIYKLNYNHIEPTDENILKYSSDELFNIYWIYEILEQLQTLPESYKKKFDNEYSSILKQAYENKSTINAVIDKFYKQISHIIKQSKRLLKYYKDIIGYDKINENYHFNSFARYGAIKRKIRKMDI